MSRKLFYFFIVEIALMGCTAREDKQLYPNPDDKLFSPRNVLLIVIDDLNISLGTYGHPVVKTPNIDLLAQEGIQFNGAYCNFPICSPSRSSFLTGLSPETIGVLDNFTPIESILQDRTTLPHLFRKNGFHTVSIGKVFHSSGAYDDSNAWEERYRFTPTATGKIGTGRNLTNGELQWCEWLAADGEDEDQPDGMNAAKAIDIISEQGENPWFIAVGFHKPHDPFISPRKYFSLYPLEDCVPPMVPDDWQKPNFYSTPNLYSQFQSFSDQDKRELLRAYYSAISFIDAQIGKIINELKLSGQFKNTLIVLLGDNGYHLGEHNWWNKGTLYERSTNIPLIISGAELPFKGVQTNALVELLDLYPTLADIFELEETPTYLEGESFKNIIQNPNTSTFRREVRSIVRRDNMLGRTVKNENYRYTQWGDKNESFELYDEKNDPLEYENLAKSTKHLSIIKDMKAKITSDK